MHRTFYKNQIILIFFSSTLVNKVGLCSDFVNPHIKNYTKLNVLILVHIKHELVDFFSG